MREQSSERIEHIFIYIVGTVHALLHFTVGIIWENVDLPAGNSTLLSLPYFGGYLTLLGVAMLLIFLYFWLSLKKEPKVPIHIRKFYVTLSIIITVASLVLFVVMCIRTNDYRIEKDQIARQAYYGAVLMTVVDILATVFFIPSYIYLLICSCKQVQQMKQASKDPPNTPTTERQLYIQHRASTGSSDQPNVQPHRLSSQPEEVITINDNLQINLEYERKGVSQSEPQTEDCQVQTKVYKRDVGVVG